LTGFTVVVLFLAVVTRRLSIKRSLLCFCHLSLSIGVVFLLYPAMWCSRLKR
jgi:hypothetical protein